MNGIYYISIAPPLAIVLVDLIGYCVDKAIAHIPLSLNSNFLLDNRSINEDQTSDRWSLIPYHEQTILNA